MNELIELSNHFTVEYQKYKDTGAIYWTVKLLGDKPHIGEGDTLEEAIHDLHRRQDVKEFSHQLEKARIGVKTVADWKANIKAIL